jgi:hypothetical protein
MLEQALWTQRKPSMSSVTRTSTLEIILSPCNRMEVIGLDTPPVAGRMAESSPTTSVNFSRPPWHHDGLPL